jgi:hypothetical protein
MLPELGPTRLTCRWQYVAALLATLAFVGLLIFLAGRC